MTDVPPALTPNVTFEKYASLLADPNWVGSLAVSVMVTVLRMVIAIVFGALAAYPLARSTCPGSG